MLIDKEFIEIPHDEVARLFWADADEHAEAMQSSTFKIPFIGLVSEIAH